ncbi:autotransporter domain-containing protein [Xanthobacter autotrophicus]|uniref:autotransporter outer membrane beta-barrel domain-containing protein n=1 Tax=Xanthobacter autotrophicus TaxID=280 RepID=UPI001E379F9E|nr:autotransporter outer membrane beta-barrel domain-containing protein [Xanthobacter autotrophicus]UDQ88269.1 autotransporter domain-containing protein [Xanthobacter autotrophicus]
MSRLFATSLLASTSLLALALAGPVANAGDYVIPSGTVVAAPVVVSTSTPGAPFGSVINQGGIVYSETAKNSSFALTVDAPALTNGITNAGTISVTQSLTKLSVAAGSTQPSTSAETKGILIYPAPSPTPLSGSIENSGSIQASRIINAAPVIGSGDVAVNEYAQGIHVATYFAGGIVNTNSGVLDISNDVTAVYSPVAGNSSMTLTTNVSAIGVLSVSSAAANSIDNAGTISVRARGAITEKLVTSSAAWLLAAATARAIGVQMSQLGASMPPGVSGATLANSGIIDVVASITHTTNFTVATTLNIPPARLIESSAVVFASGISTTEAQITSFQNTGTISVGGSALSVSNASVSAYNTAALLNYNDPKSPQTNPEMGSVTAYGVSFANGSLGDLTNSGSIDVTGVADTTASASASALDKTRVAQQNFAAVTLTGINVAADTLTGPIVNSGAVNLSATASLQSQSTASSNGTPTTKKAEVAASGYLYTHLAGISVVASGYAASDYSATVRNSGVIKLTSKATGSQSGLALSEREAEATVTYSAGANFLSGALLFATNSAAGVYISAPNVAEVTNSGIIDVSSTYASNLSATAGGDGKAATATATSGPSSFNSFGLNITEVAGGPSTGTVATTGITNSGTIALSSAVALTNAAAANASLSDGAAVASALSQSTALSSLPGLDGAIAASYGVYARLDGLAGNLTNSGVISVDQALTVTTVGSAAGASAQATSVADGLSLAMGILALPGAVTGSLVNSGDITAIASGTFGAVASATAASGKAEADADATGIVLASGIIASADGMAGFSNTADILSKASAKTTVSAAGSGSGEVKTSAHGVGSAMALGVMLSGTGKISGGFTNTGTIGATALSSVTASGSGGTVSTDATAVSSAFGLLTGAGAGIGGDLVNTGTIGAVANASATASGGTADASAFAYGLALNATGGIGGSIVNSGTVMAIAGADATGASRSAKATAVGLQLASGTVGGALANTGTIAAQASGTDATAIGIAIGSTIDGKALGAAEVTTLETLKVDTALAVAGAVTLTDGLVNTGTIAATTGASGNATAIKVAGGSSIGTLTNRGSIIAAEGNTAGVAIDLTGEGSATHVLLQDGSVYGDLALSSTYADAITWSGGTLSGDVLGGGLGSLTVLAGVDTAFAYSGTLESLAKVSVGGDGTPVSLAFTGTAVGIGTFAVKDQGTLILTSDSAIETKSYTQSAGGTLGVYLSPQWTAAPIVATSADLGGTVAVLGASGLRAKTTSYDLVASSDISGSFADVTTPNSLLSAAVTYDADGATLVLTRNATTSLAGLSLAGRSLAAGIDLNYQRLSLSSPLSPVLDSFYSGTDGQVATLLNQMSGAPLADAKTAGMASFGTINGQISQQLAATRGTGALPSGGSALLSYGAGEVNLSGNAYAATGSASGGSSPWAALSPAAAPVPQNGVWLRPFGNWGSYDTGNGTVSSSGGGVLGGIERAFGDDARGGAVFSYQTANLGFTTPASGSVDQWTASLYAEKQWGAFYANLFGTYGYQTYDMSRSIAYGGTLFTARSNFAGNAGAVVGEAGYDYSYAPSAKLEPYLRLAYAALGTETFAERGAGVFNLNVAADTTQSLQSTLGLRVIQPLSFSTLPVTLRLEAGWQHEYLDTGASLGAAFLSDSTIAFNILSGGPSDMALAAAGLSFALSANLDGYLEYRGSFGDGYSNSTASAQLRLRF